MDQTTLVLAHFAACDKTADQLHDLLESLLTPTRAEAGCVMYNLWRSRADPRRFTLVEAWASDGALDRHLETPHLIDAKQRFPDLLAEPLRIERFDMIGPGSPA
jgi:quinol monooxygenase YgiN